MRPVRTIDFETFGIESRPDYPPRPVGVALKEPGRSPVYLAWGHPTENNSTLAKARQILRQWYRESSRVPLLFHHGKFDLDVAETHLGLALPPWHQIHDTLYLAFLDDPHATKLDLKTLAVKHLDETLAERDELAEWVREHVRTTEKGGGGEVRVDPVSAKGLFRVPPSKAGAFYAYAPGGLVGRYAAADVRQTEGVFHKLYPSVIERGMGLAYDRERRLLPVLLRMERQGVPVGERWLREAADRGQQDIDTTDAWLRRRLKAPELDVDSNEELADALEAAGEVTSWVLTEKGNRSTARDNLMQCVEDQSLLNVLSYRGKLATVTRTFLRKWAATAERSGGLIYTNWNQVRHDEHGAGAGARTGRLSSNPNFQNAVKRRSQIVTNERDRKRFEDQEIEAFHLPSALAKRVHDFPYVRDAIVARRGRVIYDRDYSQQELRALGHYEGGPLLAAYLENPQLDMHDFAKDLTNELLNSNFPRKPIKNMGFGLIYGMGIGKLAKQMGVDVNTAKRLKDAYLTIFPGLGELIKELNRRGRRNEPIYTWGGREYYVEPPRFINGHRRTFEYKLLNVLIQGSSADCTKEAAIRYDDLRHEDANLLLLVHDEFVGSAPKKLLRREMTALREAMTSVEFDVEMLSDGKWSDVGWGHLTKYEETA